MFEYGVEYKIPPGLKTLRVVRQGTGLRVEADPEDLGITSIYYFGGFAPHHACFQAEGKDEVFDVWIDEYEAYPRKVEFTAAQ